MSRLKTKRMLRTCELVLGEGGGGKVRGIGGEDLGLAFWSLLRGFRVNLCELRSQRAECLNGSKCRQKTTACS